MKLNKSMIRTSIWLLGLLTGIYSVQGVDSLNKIKPIPTAVAKEISMEKSRSFPGVVRAFRRVDLGFNVPGQLEYLNAAEGSRLKKGELIARLDPRDFQFRFDTAEAHFKQAKAEFDRKKQLLEDKVISKAEFDRVEAAFLSAVAGLDIARKALEDTELFAPFDAAVAKRNFENYEQIVPKVTVISLHDIDEVEVVVSIPELIIATKTEEDLQSINVRFDAAPDKTYKAKIGEFSLTPNRTTRTYEGTVVLKSPDNLRILTGMTAKVEVVFKNLNKREGGVRVPSSAVFAKSGDQSYVWVIPQHGGQADLREVVIGSLFHDEIEITSGLKAGELVAIAGVHSLEEGQAVRPSKSNAEGLEQ